MVMRTSGCVIGVNAPQGTRALGNVLPVYGKDVSCTWMGADIERGISLALG